MATREKSLMNANLRLLACQIEIPHVANKEEKTRHLNVVAEKIKTHLSETETGVDLISIGALTHSAPVFDFSLLLEGV